jgi:hypothetical protein
MIFNHQISKNEFWALWFKYLAGEMFTSDTLLTELHMEQQILLDDNMQRKDESVNGQVKTDIGWYESFHARYSSNRRMKDMFFDENVVVNLIYISIYILFCR